METAELFHEMALKPMVIWKDTNPIISYSKINGSQSKWCYLISSTAGIIAFASKFQCHTLLALPFDLQKSSTSSGEQVHLL